MPRPNLLGVALTLAAVAPTLLGAQSGRRDTADLILVGGKVFTADPARPWAEAIAIRGSRILTVGTTVEIERLASAGTRRIRLGGRTVVPGFDDAHDHVGFSGPQGITVAVDPSPTPDPPLTQVLDSLRAAAGRVKPGTWLSVTVGGQVFDSPRATRFVLDSVVPSHPIALWGWSGHGAVFNSAGLEAAGLLRAPDPVGGWQTRDPQGLPTGRIDEYALYGVQRRFALTRSDTALARLVRTWGEEGLQLGITSIQDMATGYDLATARTVVTGSGVRTRYRVMPFPQTDGPGGLLGDWRTNGSDSAIGPGIQMSGVKWVLDGTPIERLALMRQPYTDRPGWYGRANFSFDTLRVLLRDALTRAQQPLLHAVGDSSIALVIAAMRAEAPDSAWRRLRPRLEHADGMGRDQVAAIKALGIVVVQNPAHLAIPEVMNARWGPERLSRIDMMRSLVDSGVPLALGSDGPRAPGLNLMLATLHPNVPSEALTREQAVTAYTRGSAYAAFADTERGTIAPGMLADLAVLSQDVFAIRPDALPTTTSLLTLVGGRVLHDALPRAPRR